MTLDAPASPISLKDALLLGAARTSARDAELLLRCATAKDRAFLLTHPEAELTPEQRATYESWLARRARHEPVQYIVGEQEFYGLPFLVTPDVLIPRPETEHLVEAALARIEKGAAFQVADVGTGSGAIAVTLAHERPHSTLFALDISPSALEVARANAQRHAVADRLQLLESNLLEAVATLQFDMIVSNPPYVSENEVLEPQVRDYEPYTALFAGPSGLEIYQRLIPQAYQALRPHGWLLMEIGHGQRDALAALLSQWAEVEFCVDLQQIPRVVMARRP